MKRLYGLLGLCCRAGRLVTGEESVEKFIRGGSAKAAFMDAGISVNGRRAIENACKTYNVKLIELPEGAIAQYTGRDGRMCAATGDAGFAKKILEVYQIISGVHE